MCGQISSGLKAETGFVTIAPKSLSIYTCNEPIAFMNITYVFSTILGLGTAGIILYLLRRDALSVGYSLWWLAVTLGLIVLSLFPAIIDTLGKILGIHYPPILLLIIALCVVLIKLLFMDLDRSRQERHIRILFQRLAIVEHALELQSYYCELSSDDSAVQDRKGKIIQEESEDSC